MHLPYRVTSNKNTSMSAVLILSPVIQKWTPFLHGLLFLIIGNFGTMSLQLLATIEVTFIKFSPHFRKLSLFFWNFISQLGTLLLIEFLQVGLLWNSKALYQFGTRLQWFLILVIVGGFKGFRVININANLGQPTIIMIDFIIIMKRKCQ